MVEICTRRLSSIRKKGLLLRRLSYGTCLGRWWVGSRVYMIRTSFIETWNVLICSWHGMEGSSWVTWTCRKLRNVVDFCLRKQELRTMLVQRSGKINLMTWRVIYGLSAVSSMNWSPWNLPSKLQIWTCSTRRYSQVSILRFRLLTPVKWHKWYLSYSRWYHRTDLAVRLSLNTPGCQVR